jgi:hypothetical protein
MHRSTFERLSGELDSLVALSTMRLAESLGITVKSGAEPSSARETVGDGGAR